MLKAPPITARGSIKYPSRSSRSKAPPSGSAAAEGNAITLKVEDTILLTDNAGEPMSGLDPAEGGVKPAAGAIPALPQTVNGRVALDPEAIVSAGRW